MSEEKIEKIETTLEELDVDFFEFIQLKKRIKLSKDIFDENSIPPYSSLLTVSSLYGFFLAGTSKGFIYALTKDLRNAFYSSDTESDKPFAQGIHVNITEGRVHLLKLTSDQLTIIVGVEGGQILCYDVTIFSSESSKIQPYQTMKFSDNVVDIRPNPGENNKIIAFLLESGTVSIKDLISDVEIGSVKNSKLGEQVTAICWSPKGRQLACGSQSGRLVQFTPDGIVKSTYQAPPGIQESTYYVRNVLWLENSIFIVTYFPIVQDEDSEHIVYLISNENKSKTVYNQIPNICFSSPRNKASYMFMESIKDWGSDLTNMVICACTNSSDTNLIARSDSGTWSNWSLSETSRAILPLSSHHVDETLPIGMALDQTSTEPWVTKLTGDEDSQIPPVPILFIFNDESEIVAFRCLQKNAYLAGKPYPGMTTAIPIPSIGPSSGKISPKSSYEPAIFESKPGPSFVSNKISVPVNTPTTAIISRDKISLGPTNNLQAAKNNATNTIVKDNAQNATSIKQLSPTRPDINKPHYIRLDATKKSVHEIQYLIKDIEENYIIKYYEQTNADCLDNPNDWSIGDLPVIISETKRLEKETKNIIDSLSFLKQEATSLKLNFVKEDAMTKQEIGLLVSPQKVTPTHRGTIQSRITEKYEKAFQDVKDNADKLEKQLDELHEQIKDHKANKHTGSTPLDYIDRSVQNISKGLYSNASQIEQVNTQLNFISEQLASISFNEDADTFVSRKIEHDTRKNTIPVKCSDENEEKTSKLMEKEWKLSKFLIVNDKRQVPYGTNLYSDLEPSEPMPKVISPRKSQSPFKTRDSIQISSENPNEPHKPIDRNTMRYGSSLRNNHTFGEESDYYNELDTPIKRNTYSEFNLPINEDTNPKNKPPISEIRERRLRYFEKEKDDIIENEYSDNTSESEDDENYQEDDKSNLYLSDLDSEPSYSPTQTSLRETRVRFQETYETRIYDVADENTGDSMQNKFDKIIGSDVSRLSKISNIPGYISSPETFEQKEITSSDKDDLDDFESEIDTLSKPEFLQYYDGEESNYDEAIEKLAELEKKEEFIEPYKGDNTSLEEISQVAAEPGVESKPEEVLQQKPTNEEIDIINESNNFAAGFGSFGLGEPSSLPSSTSSLGMFGLSTSNAQQKDITFGQPTQGSTPFSSTSPSSLHFGTATPIPSVYRGEIPNAFNIGSIPPALAAANSNVVNAFSQPQQPQPFGQSPLIPNALAPPTFGQPGFNSPAFGQTGFQSSAFGQPAFGMPGLGTPSSFTKTPALKAPDGAGFARFASNTTGFGGNGGSASVTSTPGFGFTSTPVGGFRSTSNTSAPSIKPSSSTSSSIWNQFR
ncbi:13995_t:CDS:10 [Funneliformis geosporum]|uniref:2598_t:CDS:1 n=1 Tax=Funneliformis geosporum TaxID=1117311 RepID=A0A9W4SC62_9GLOM|nr:2598_t:CDS:10 [Funneliformis geosporum]CAI2167526.1 13995_t:CDS:10 [Funneliformis geosporum]